MDKKIEFLNNFKDCYKDKGSVLLCVQLDGFTHKVYYLDLQGNICTDSYSACCPEQRYEQDNYSMNSDRAIAFFKGTPHQSAKEFIYHYANEIPKLRHNLLLKKACEIARTSTVSIQGE